MAPGPQFVCPKLSIHLIHVLEQTMLIPGNESCFGHMQRGRMANWMRQTTPWADQPSTRRVLCGIRLARKRQWACSLHWRFEEKHQREHTHFWRFRLGTTPRSFNSLYLPRFPFDQKGKNSTLEGQEDACKPLLSPGRRWLPFE